MQKIEISTLDLRYENYRLKNRTEEVRLLSSMRERGIEEPLEVVEKEDTKILLNGFKRYRCAKKLKIHIVPVISLGKDEVTGIVEVIRVSNQHTLNILEQARFIKDLRDCHKMPVSEIADTLSRSRAWVSMRLSLITEISGKIEKILFSGGFPPYSYMYTIRHFMRMNKAPKEDIEAFVEAVSGRKLSYRQIELLAHGFFRGPEWFRREILEGKISFALERMEQVPENLESCSESERVVLKNLEIVQKYMQRLMAACQDKRLKSPVFNAQANLVAAGILSRLGAFKKAMRDLYDRTG